MQMRRTSKYPPDFLRPPSLPRTAHHVEQSIEERQAFSPGKRALFDQALHVVVRNFPVLAHLVVKAARRAPSLLVPSLRCVRRLATPYGAKNHSALAGCHVRICRDQTGRAQAPARLRPRPVLVFDGQATGATLSNVVDGVRSGGPTVAIIADRTMGIPLITNGSSLATRSRTNAPALRVRAPVAAH